VDAADEHPDYGIIGPVLLSPRSTAGGRWLPPNAIEIPFGSETGFLEREWASGACMLLRRECVRQTGKFDERFGSYIDDVDYCLRARDHGWRIGVNADAVTWGLGTISPRAREMVEVNSVRLVVKRSGFRGLSSIVAPLLVLIVRNATAAIAPWRSAARRQSSRAFLRQRVDLLSRILTALTQSKPPRNGWEHEVSAGWRQ
jgi:GT2 family glycosyltransferase